MVHKAKFVQSRAKKPNHVFNDCQANAAKPRTGKFAK